MQDLKNVLTRTILDRLAFSSILSLTQGGAYLIKIGVGYGVSREHFSLVWCRDHGVECRHIIFRESVERIQSY